MISVIHMCEGTQGVRREKERQRDKDREREGREEEKEEEEEEKGEGGRGGEETMVPNRDTDCW